MAQKTQKSETFITFKDEGEARFTDASIVKDAAGRAIDVVTGG